MKTKDGTLQLLSTFTNRLGNMMYNFGAMNFSLLTTISRGPYGEKYQNRYHRNLMTMMDHMGAQIPQKVSTCAKTKIFWKTENMGLGNANAEEPLILSSKPSSEVSDMVDRKWLKWNRDEDVSDDGAFRNKTYALSDGSEMPLSKEECMAMIVSRPFCLMLEKHIQLRYCSIFLGRQ